MRYAHGEGVRVARPVPRPCLHGCLLYRVRARDSLRPRVLCMQLRCSPARSRSRSGTAPTTSSRLRLRRVSTFCVLTETTVLWGSVLEVGTRASPSATSTGRAPVRQKPVSCIHRANYTIRAFTPRATRLYPSPPCLALTADHGVMVVLPGTQRLCGV